jgi:hypothetical protein
MMDELTAALTDLGRAAEDRGGHQDPHRMARSSCINAPPATRRTQQPPTAKGRAGDQDSTSLGLRSLCGAQAELLQPLDEVRPLCAVVARYVQSGAEPIVGSEREVGAALVE